MSNNASVFKTVFDSTPLNDGLYFFLQRVYRHYPEDEFHLALAMAAKEKNTDEEIYKEAQSRLPEIKPFMAKFTYALPGLRSLKKAMAAQTMRLLGDRKILHGSLEIGSAGGFINRLGKNIKLKGGRHVIHTVAPTNSLADIFERGSLLKPNKFLPLNWQPISVANIADESLDIVACYHGLHHCPAEMLPAFLASINRVLRKGGLFIVREHDIQTPVMEALVLFTHTVINLGSGVPWAKNITDVVFIKPVSGWSEIISAAGFEDAGARLMVDKDPVRNMLMGFVKL